jgi:hypothetical protein
LIGQGVFGKLVDSLITSATYEAHEGERVVCDTTVTTVTLPTSITTEWFGNSGYIGGSTDYGWSNSQVVVYPRTPRDNAIIQIAAQDDPANSETHIYDAPRAEWVEITTLGLSDNAPLSDRYAEALKALLAIKLAPHYNIEPNPFLQAENSKANLLLSNRPDRAYRPVQAYYF